MLLLLFKAKWKPFTWYSESDLYNECVCARVCVVNVCFSSGVQRVPRRSVGVLVHFSFPSLLTRGHILPFGLFAFFIRAPHSLAVFFHPLGIPVADQLQKLLVPQPGVGAWDWGWQQSPGADAGAWWAANGGVANGDSLLSPCLIRPVNGWLHPLPSQHV